MNDAEVKLQVKLDNNSAEKSINSLETRTQKLQKAFSKAGKIMTASLTVPIAGLIANGINYNKTLETLTTSFKTMTGSADKAKNIMEKLTELGAKTPFETATLAEVTKLLMNYGLTADDAIDKMEMLGDISQGNADKMNRISMAYGQMSSAGKVSLEDVKQMIEAGFNPLKEISESTGESMSSLYDRISKGTISVDEITASMQRSTTEGGKYFGSMQEQSQTTEGKLSTLKDGFNQATGSLTESLIPTLQNLVDKLINLSNWFSNLDEGQKNMILTALGVAAALGPILLVISGLIGAIGTINAVIGFLVSPIGLVIVAVGAIIAIIVLMVKNWNKVQEVAGMVFNAIVGGLKWLGGQIMSVMNSIGGFIGGIASWIANTFMNAFNTVVNGARWLWNTIIGFVSAVGTAIGNAIWGTIKGIVNGIITLAENTINGFIKGINNVIGLINNIPGVNIGMIQALRIPKLSTGTNYIAREGLAYLHQGEAVVPKKYNPTLGGGGATNIVIENTFTMEGQKVGRILTPLISKNLKTAGAFR